LKNPYAFMPDNIKSMIQEKEGMAWGRATNSVAYLDVSDFDTSNLTSEETELLIQGTIQWSALNNHRWASNNSVFAKVGMPYKQYEKDIATNGEPGFLWLENCRNFGRMIDGFKEGIDGEVVGSNPCAEQSLEDSELCCLVESFPNLHQDDEDYKRTLKFAFLYAKTVTLLPTHSARTNAVMLRNRRIGLSQSGIVQAFAQFGRREVLNKFCDEGYNVIKQWDKVYSKWLCIPQSIKITSVKPSGTVSLLTGCTPGIHYPEAQHYWRRVRVKSDSPLVQILRDAGYHVEPSVTDPVNTVVIKFAVSDPRVKPTNEVSIFEQVANTVDYQRYWADNQVSVTIKFKAEEAKDIASVLEIYEDQLKSISFLPHSNHGYAQAPYEPCTEQEVLDYNAQLKDLDFSAYYGKEEGSNFCDSDSCAV
jgi:adenosylcobalamin-dependent ribonucleoside-triphosphate reductase